MSPSCIASAYSFSDAFVDIIVASTNTINIGANFTVVCLNKKGKKFLRR